MIDAARLTNQALDFRKIQSPDLLLLSYSGRNYYDSARQSVDEAHLRCNRPYRLMLHMHVRSIQHSRLTSEMQRDPCCEAFSPRSASSIPVIPSSGKLHGSCLDLMQVSSQQFSSRIGCMFVLNTKSSLICRSSRCGPLPHWMLEVQDAAWVDIVCFDSVLCVFFG